MMLDLNSGNESLLFSLRLNALSFDTEAKPTNFYNSITFMIYKYAVPHGMRYAVDIEPKIRAFRVTSTFSLGLERPVGSTWVKVSNTAAYSSGFISDRYASITLNQTAMDADHVRVRKLAYMLIASVEMTGASRSGNAISTYRIIWRFKYSIKQIIEYGGSTWILFHSDVLNKLYRKFKFPCFIWYFSSKESFCLFTIPHQRFPNYIHASALKLKKCPVLKFFGRLDPEHRAPCYAL